MSHTDIPDKTVSQRRRNKKGTKQGAAVLRNGTVIRMISIVVMLGILAFLIYHME